MLTPLFSLEDALGSVVQVSFFAATVSRSPAFQKSRASPRPCNRNRLRIITLTMNRPIQVLVLSADAARVCQWCHFLADSDTQVWQDVRELPRDAVPDVIVTDQDFGDDEASSGLGPTMPRGWLNF